MSVSASKETEAIARLREKLRTEMRISREGQRQESADTIRIAIGENYTENLHTYTQDEVLKLAKTIKLQKHANPHQLNQLCHAFLQSAENIQDFLNVTGSLNVIVKAFTGTNSDTQLLAAECVCNLSLGSEISCEKLTLHVASYLITFLKSSNERLLRTSLWVITNLIASGEKSVKILVDQEVIRSLMNVEANALDDAIKEDALQAINVALDSTSLRQKDVSFLIEWIPSIVASPLLSFVSTKTLYKLLNKLNFQWSGHSVDLVESVMRLCVDTVFHLYRSIQSASTEGSKPQSHIIILFRIIGNLLATNEWSANCIITHGFAANKEEVIHFFKFLLERMDSNASQREVLWVARNLLENKHLNNHCITYVNCDGFGMNMLIEYWRDLSNVEKTVKFSASH